jgi:hypothetical protein
MKDLKNNVTLASSLNPAARTATASGTGADIQGVESAIVLFSCGAITDGTHTPSIEHSDVLGSGYVAVPASDSIGSLVAMTANSVQQIGYIGMKRYVRAVITVAGATTGAVNSACVVRSNARHHGGTAV